MGMENGMKRIIGFLFVFLFLLVQLLIQSGKFSFAFLILLGLIVAVAFFSEENRLFVWMTAGFSAGLIFYIYIDRIFLALSPSQGISLIISRVLLLIPIVIISYIAYKFKNNFIIFFKKPDWKKEIDLPFKKGKTFSFQSFFLFILFIQIFVLCYFFFTASHPSLHTIMHFLLFAVINGIMIEVLWRGLLMAKMIQLIGNWPGIIAASLSNVFYYYMHGLPVNYCFLLFFFGMLNGFAAIQTKSLWPPFIWNGMMTLILIFSYQIPFVV